MKNNSTLKYGSYASIITGLVVVIAIVVNLIATQFNIKFDLTRNKLYTLSEDTVALLEGIDEEITIYSIYQDGNEISVVTEILEKYASHSKLITTKNIDPYKNPQFATKYAKNGDTISIGSVVVETKDAYKVISQDQLAEVYTGTNGETYMQGIKLEGVLTGAIRNITSGETSVLYALTGHGESVIEGDLLTEFEYSGYSVSDLNLIKNNAIPEDCKVLIINAPVEDIRADELKTIKDYLDGGGSAFITLGLTVADMTNFNSLLANYGVASSNRLVIEGSADYVYQMNPYYLIPLLSTENNISSKLAETNTSVFIPYSLNIENLETKRATVSVSPFMATSEYSYSKSFEEIETSQQGENDPQGPFVLGASITDVDVNGNEEGVKIVVFGAESILESSMNAAVNGGNYGVVMNGVDWLAGNEGALHSKSLGAEDYLQLTQSKAIVIMIFSVIVIPLIILVIGLVVVVRRKNK